MALVDRPQRLRPPVVGLDPRLVTRASGPGRVRGAALDLLSRIQDDPGRAEILMREGLRAARHLHSAERRAVSDGLRAILRHRGWLVAAIDLDDPLALWLSWLAIQGLPPEAAEAAWVVEGRPPRLFSGALAPMVALPDDPVRALALLGSISNAFAAALLDDLDDPVGFLAASHRRAPLALRANRARISRDDLLARLAREGLAAHASALAPDGIVADAPADVTTLPTFRDGLFEVQDEGSQLIGEMAIRDGRPAIAIDFCAGAGGKTLQIAAISPKTRILSLDVRASALDELARRARRAGVRHLKIAAFPAPGMLPPLAREQEGAADLVIVDAPCSGSGTLRRSTGLLSRIDGPLLDEMTGRQAEILALASRLVAPGGRLLYATCSVLRRENEAIIERFLSERPEYRLSGPVLSVAPHTHGTDGFFAAVIAKSV